MPEASTARGEEISPSLGQGYYHKSGHFWPQKTLNVPFHISLGTLALQNPKDLGMLSYLRLFPVAEDQKQQIHVTTGSFDMTGSWPRERITSTQCEQAELEETVG